jgi:flagellar biosynthesis protein
MARPTRKRAAALRYDPPKDEAPRVVARGRGIVAEKIIEIAREHGVRIHEDPMLVEVLAQLDIGDQIPEKLYKVVAEILAFIYTVDRRLAPPGR